MSLRLYEFLKLNKYYLLVFLIPISLATGPAAPDIIISLSSLIFLYEYHKTIFSRKFLSDKVVIAFIAFWLYLIVNSLINDIGYLGKSIVIIRFFFLIFTKKVFLKVVALVKYY